MGLVSTAASPVVVSHEWLLEVVGDIFQAVGFSEVAATTVAGALVYADLSGISSHALCGAGAEGVGQPA
jgi:LDH2 family malate/lactate/ureidoglycolate dehydrogenase